MKQSSSTLCLFQLKPVESRPNCNQELTSVVLQQFYRTERVKHLCSVCFRCIRRQRRVFQLAENGDLKSPQCRFKSDHGDHALLSQSAEEIASKAIQSWFESKMRHHYEEVAERLNVPVLKTDVRKTYRGFKSFLPRHTQWLYQLRH